MAAATTAAAAAAAAAACPRIAARRPRPRSLGVKLKMNLTLTLTLTTAPNSNPDPDLNPNPNPDPDPNPNPNPLTRWSARRGQRLGGGDRRANALVVVAAVRAERRRACRSKGANVAAGGVAPAGPHRHRMPGAVAAALPQP